VRADRLFWGDGVTLRLRYCVISLTGGDRSAEHSEVTDFVIEKKNPPFSGGLGEGDSRTNLTIGNAANNEIMQNSLQGYGV
jgi:hypothetical protein